MNGRREAARPEPARSGAAASKVLEVDVARGFFGRARGMLCRAPLPARVGLLLERTRCVHGIGMGRSLDLLFLDAASNVCRVCTLAPLGSRACARAIMVVEFEAGELAALDVRVGDRVELLRRDPRVPTSASDAGTAAIDHGASCAMVVALLSVLLLSTNAQAQLAGVFPPGWVSRFEGRAESLYRANEDAAAIQAFETLARMDPSLRALSVLRIGNVHQRHGRHWQALQAYHEALELPAPPDDRMREAQRKALTNLLQLLDSFADVAARALADPPEVTTSAPVPPHPVPPRLESPVPASPIPASPFPMTSVGAAPVGEARSGSGALPKIEYLPVSRSAPTLPSGGGRARRSW